MSTRSLRKRPSPVKVEAEEDEPVAKKSKASTKKVAQAKPKKDTQAKPSKNDIQDKPAKKDTKVAKKPKAKSKDTVKDEIDDVDDQVLSSSAKPGGKKVAAKNKKKQTKKDKENIDTSNIKTEPVAEKTGVERSVVKKGRAPVDGLCPVASTAHVFWDKDEHDNDVIWDCMLNQTNIQFNNNKFYLIQLLKHDTKEEYYTWMRWGRVGANGQTNLNNCGTSLEHAKKVFTKKFSDKTKNEWEDIEIFEKVPGKYDLVKLDYSETTEDEVDMKPVIKQEDEPPKKIESELKPAVKSLIELICDIKVMEDAVMEMKYDAKKAPLGKLTTSQITAGYSALKKIDELIGAGKISNRDLLDACNAFYTRIPHYFGMRVPPLIRTQGEVKEKIKLLEALGDIQAALNMIGKPIDIDCHPTDQRYKSLDCDIQEIEKDTKIYKLLEEYLQSTHASTHRGYKMKLLDIFECSKPNEKDRFKDVGNRKLLWHGSRLSNWAGILGQGLRIAPPEAPVTGYMFGKGVYFADMSSKSANYCCISRKNNIGFLTLCEVSLGKCNELLNANYNANKLPSGCHSVKGLGQTAPDPKKVQYLDDGTEVPLGPGISTGIKNPSGYCLQYNEYIVYDVSQIKIRYLLKVQFDQ